MKTTISMALLLCLLLACGAPVCGVDWCADGVCVRRESGDLECRDRCNYDSDCGETEACLQYQHDPGVRACLPRP